MSDVVPDFFRHQSRHLTGTSRLIQGGGLNAPLATFEANGFGEEAWQPAIAETILAMRLSGAPVRCAWGERAGVGSRVSADWALQPAGTPNHYIAKQAVRFLQIFLPERLIDRCAEALRPGSSASRSLRTDLVFVSDSELTTRIRQYGQAAMHGATALELEARAILVVQHLLCQHHGFAKPKEMRRGQLAAWQVARVRELISSQLHEDSSLDRLAAEVRLSPFHFARCFKMTTGESPHRYLVRMRIERACEMLIRSSLSVTEISAQVGYPDPSYFARLFRKAMGVTPANYRRLCQNTSKLELSAAPP